MAFVIPVVEHWLEREIAKWIHHEGSGRKEGNVLFNDALNTFYLTLYGVRRTILIVRKKTCCHHMGYSFRLTARVLLYAPSHRQDSTYHSIWYNSHGAHAGTRNSSMGPPHEGSIRRPIAPWANILTTELHLAPIHRNMSAVTWLPFGLTKYVISVYLVLSDLSCYIFSDSSNIARL